VEPVPKHFYSQSGVIPLSRETGAPRIMLISSRSGKRWVIPKGVVDPGLSPLESAVKEAWEEAGLRGRVDEKALGRYEYRKWQGTCRVEVFVMEVEHQSEQWPEGEVRDRRWLPPERAAELVRESDLAVMIRRAAEMGEPAR
jgi:8-oxo-dGTP pyrophosphatase MutT (NUDIX family)